MKTKFLSGIAALSLVAVLFTSCGSIPQVEIDAANSAIDEASAIGAEVYDRDNFMALEDSMKSVMAGIEKENSNFIKSFSSSKESLAGVTMFAQEVKQQTIIRKEELKSEVQTIISGVQSLVLENEALILQAPKGKEGASALVAIKGELVNIETAVQEASTLLTNEDFMAALDKANAARAQAAAINAELTMVIDKYNAKGKRK